MSFARPISRPPAHREVLAREACKSVIHAYAELSITDDERLVAIRRKLLKIDEELQEYLYHYGDLEDDAEQPRPLGTYTEWLKGETTTSEPLLDEGDMK